MDTVQRAFLLRHFDAKSWYGKSPYRIRAFKAATLEDVKIRSWKKQQSFYFKKGAMLMTRSLWGREELPHAFLSVEQMECPSTRGAHRTLLDILGNFESGAVERDRTRSACGDVAFVLGQTMCLFARANVVVWIRNKGPTVVSVGVIAKGFDRALARAFDRQKRQRRAALGQPR